MASGQNIQCTICDFRQKDVAAIVWCPECDEGFCQICVEHHNLSRLTKGHKALQVEDYVKITPVIQEIKQYCVDHNEKFDFLCPNDDSLCCRKCVTTTHSKCTDLIALEDVVTASNSTTLLQDIKRNVECQLVNLENIRKDRQGNKKLVLEQKDKFCSDIKTVRAKINEYVDQLETKLVEELDFSTDLQLKEIEKVVNEVDSKHDDVTKLNADAMKLKDNDINLQKFLGVRKLDGLASKTESDIKNLIQSNKFDRISVEMNISSDVSTFLSRIKSLGMIRVVVKPRTVPVLNWKEFQAQTASTLPASVQMTESKLLLRLSTRVHAPKGKLGVNVTGCAISPCGQIYVADFSPGKRIMTVNKEGIYSTVVNFADSPVFDIACIDSSNIAMSSGSYREIRVLNITDNKISNKRKTTGNNYGITCANGCLMYCVGNQNIETLNLSDESVSEFKSGKLKNNAYVCHKDDCVYHTSSNGSSVVCRDSSGRVLWDFRTDRLKHPRGITVDNKGRVYVVGEASNNVIVIMEDGKQFTEVLTKADDIIKPTAICCDRRNDTLTICNKNGDLFVYKIQ